MPLLHTGVVREMRSGAGAAFRVMNPVAVERFYEKAFPHGAVDHAEGSRAKGVALFRNSKSLPNDTPLVITTRVMKGCSVRIDGTIVEDGKATTRDGVYAIKLSPNTNTELQGNWVLIENPSIFHAHERVFGHDRSAILLNGRMPDRLIHWLASLSSTDLQVIHAPDYDPVGLDEFDRLYRVLGDRVALHVPDTLDLLFARYSDKGLLRQEKQQALLRKHSTSRHPSILRIAGLIKRHNAGLEQEALLLSTQETCTTSHPTVGGSTLPSPP